MKKTSILKFLVGITLAASGAFAVGSTLSNKKAESVEAATPASYSKIYRFTAPANSSWGNSVYVHAWGSATSSNNTNWPGINISGEYSYNESDRKVYTFATNVTDYQYLIFHNNNGWKTNDITIGNNTAWYLDDGNAPGTWTPSNQKYYFYDYEGSFGGNAKCYAWQSNGSLNNGNYPGVTMNKTDYSSGNLYYIDLDPAFDMVKIGIGDSANTGDQWVNKHRGQTLCFWHGGEEGINWSNNLNWVKAHDWIYSTMHLKDISESNNADTGACRGANGYYQKAKTAFQSFSSAIKTEIANEQGNAVAKARLSAWAIANGETFDPSTGTFSSARNVISIPESSNNIAIIVIISLVSVTAIGGFFFIRKRKEN